MSSTLDRLRRLQALRPQRNYTDPELPPVKQAPAPGLARQPATVRLEEAAPGDVIENSGGHCYVRTVSYPLHQVRGLTALGDLLAQPPSLFAPFHPSFGLHPALDYRRAAFIDTETTGLGGAGVYCFMIGVGTFEIADFGLQVLDCGSTDQSPDFPISQFVVRQFFMRNPGEEGALLLALAELLERVEMSVTFNGRTFDLPLLRARFRQNQRVYPELRGSASLLEPDRPHLDLLHPARRLWRRRLQSCRLVNLEGEILGVQRSEEDVPGQLIPQLYTDYVRSGNAGELRRVFYHNHEDVLSMVGLAERLGRAFNPTAERPDAEATLREDWLALGACYEKLKHWSQAESAYRRALDSLCEPGAKAEAFRRLGQLLKRQARWGEAAELWQLWLTSVPGADATPYIELAKYCEWQDNDLEQAEMWTAWALHILGKLPAWQRASSQIDELQHRLARLQRKRQA